MPMFLMPNARPPFSDWRAQVERIVERRTRMPCLLDVRAMRSCYDVGLSPREIAEDLIN